jgi:hypothetical protein
MVIRGRAFALAACGTAVALLGCADIIGLRGIVDDGGVDAVADGAPQDGVAVDSDTGSGEAGMNDAPSDAPSDALAKCNKRIFFTTGSWPGSALGGLLGADGKCAAAVTAHTLGGTFKAWLSDANTDAITRVANVGPWCGLDGKTVIFASKAAMTMPPVTPPKWEETGVENGFVYYWTGTTGAGTKSQTCGSWTTGGQGTIGFSGSTTSNWTDNGSTTCADSYRVLCVEQ